MKKFLISLILLVTIVFSNEPAKAAEINGWIYTGNDYIAMCSEPKESVIKIICNSYMQGLWLGLVGYQKAVIAMAITPELKSSFEGMPEADAAAAFQKFEDAHSTFCLPDGITINQMNAMFIKYLKENPEMLQLETAALLLKKLHQTYPCK